MTTPTPPSDLIEKMKAAIEDALSVTVYEDDSQGRFVSQQYDAEIDVEGLSEAAQAAYAVVRERIEWQPIETAPREHGRMILSFNRYGAMEIICWNDSTEWWDDGDYREDAPEYPEPKFWMPLPDPPSNKGLIHDDD